jgi:Arc/MetJ-type ribon-helix-helix transcriptional regulator
MTTQIAVRLPNELVRQLDALVGAGHQTRSDAVRRAIELYLYRLACERDARRYEELPLSDAELSLADDPAAWSETPAW